MKLASILHPAFRATTAVLLLAAAACAQQGGEKLAAAPLREALPGGDQLPGSEGVQAVTLVAGLKNPWGMDFLPDGSLLVTEKEGGLKLLSPDGSDLRQVAGVPEVASVGQGGLMDVAVHPQFAENQWVYLSYTVAQDAGYTTRVGRARLQGDSLQGLQVLFTAAPSFPQRRHFGSRLLLQGGYLFVTVGDRGNRKLAQSLGSHNGKLLRLKEDGAIPMDNPFVARQGARPEIWTYGHRNPQGLAIHPQTEAIWLSEHGPQGGDEINIITRGANYGWPVITYGEEYGGGSIGEGTHREGMEQPLKYYVPSIGTGGIDFYFGDVYPGWGPSLLVAGLRQSHISRLELGDSGLGRETVLAAEPLLRIRDVQVGPDGLVYALADSSRLIRLQPVPP